ncbi:MAG: PAS domain-containing protein, partial [Spirochaetia bacterium]
MLHSGALYTHFMYVPISIACMWWGVRGMGVAAGLAGVILSMHVFGIAEEGIWNDVVRGGFFLMVAFFIGRLRDMISTGREALARSEDANRSILESATTGVLVHRDDHVIFANVRLSRLLGWEPGSMVGVPLDAFLGREEGRLLRAPLDGSELPREIPLVRRDGSQVWVEA